MGFQMHCSELEVCRLYCFLMSDSVLLLYFKKMLHENCEVEKNMLNINLQAGCNHK